MYGRQHIVVRANGSSRLVQTVLPPSGLFYLHIIVSCTMLSLFVSCRNFHIFLYFVVYHPQVSLRGACTSRESNAVQSERRGAAAQAADC
jgi:hypothetical protein